MFLVHNNFNYQPLKQLKLVLLLLQIIKSIMGKELFLKIIKEVLSKVKFNKGFKVVIKEEFKEMLKEKLIESMDNRVHNLDREEMGLSIY